MRLRHEIVLENDKLIILDVKNNRFRGAGGYFTLVIDEIDGDRVKKGILKTRKPNPLTLSSGPIADILIGWAVKSAAPQASFSARFIPIYTGKQWGKVISPDYKKAMGRKWGCPHGLIEWAIKNYRKHAPLLMDACALNWYGDLKENFYVQYYSIVSLTGCYGEQEIAAIFMACGARMEFLTVGLRGWRVMSLFICFIAKRAPARGGI